MVKEASEPLYGRFYIPQLVFDLAVSQSAVTEVCGHADKATMRELEAIKRLLKAEHEHAHHYLTLLELLINAPWDVLDDDDKFHQNVQALKNLLRLHEEKYEERKVEEINTRSGRKLYLKVKNNKITVFGDTFPVKDQLKNLGFKWDPMERVWYAPANVDVNSVMAKLAEV
jgi:ribonuclease BN (tRNA processing enzyme)